MSETKEGGSIKKEITVIVLVGMSLLLISPFILGDSYVWTDKGCGSTYKVGDPIKVYFKTFDSVRFELWNYHTGKSPACVAEGVGDGRTYYVESTVSEPAGKIIFVLKMPCDPHCPLSDMCSWDRCSIFVKDAPRECKQKLYITCNEVKYELYVDRKHIFTEGGDGKCNVELSEGTHTIQLTKKGCDPVTKPVKIACGRDSKITVTMNCDPCRNVECGTACKGYALWRQKCVNGKCVYDRKIESKSRKCGYDPCKYHCANRKQDCGEYGVDCGGGCPFKDADGDGVEDCKDRCPNSRCGKVDRNGCETDADGDGVEDCVDQCPDEKGVISNRGCPKSFLGSVSDWWSGLPTWSKYTMIGCGGFLIVVGLAELGAVGAIGGVLFRSGKLLARCGPAIGSLVVVGLRVWNTIGITVFWCRIWVQTTASPWVRDLVLKAEIKLLNTRTGWFLYNNLKEITDLLDFRSIEKYVRDPKKLLEDAIRPWEEMYRRAVRDANAVERYIRDPKSLIKDIKEKRTIKKAIEVAKKVVNEARKAVRKVARKIAMRAVREVRKVARKIAMRAVREAARKVVRKVGRRTAREVEKIGRKVAREARKVGRKIAGEVGKITIEAARKAISKTSSWIIRTLFTPRL